MNDDIITYVLLAFIGTFALFVTAIFIARYVNEFQQELKYLEMEISRSEGAEKQLWIKRKKRLWLSLLPFFRY